MAYVRPIYCQHSLHRQTLLFRFSCSAHRLIRISNLVGPCADRRHVIVDYEQMQSCEAHAIRTQGFHPLTITVAIWVYNYKASCARARLG